MALSMRFSRLEDGRLIDKEPGVSGVNVLVSTDEGKSWAKLPLVMSAVNDSVPLTKDEEAALIAKLLKL